VLARKTDTKSSQGKKQREETVDFNPTTSMEINNKPIKKHNRNKKFNKLVELSFHPTL
jgi:hypothetical protein